MYCVAFISVFNRDHTIFWLPLPLSCSDQVVSLCLDDAYSTILSPTHFMEFICEYIGVTESMVSDLNYLEHVSFVA